MTTARMSFGIFMAPFHRVGENPTLAIERDLELIEHLDRLGFDEAWIGEHHSGAREIIAEPMLFIAAAAQRTRHIKLGTGVTSLPYHHPFNVADRVVQLDHMTRGRAMLGCGPGALTSDAYMLGIDTTQQRSRMSEALDAVMALLRRDGPVTMETDWFTLREARLQLAPYTHPHPHVAVATTFTPSGPTNAGRHGLGLLSVAGANDERFNRTWGWVEEAAGTTGATVSRQDWKVVMTYHISSSRERAIEELEFGYAKRAYSGDGRDGTSNAVPIFGPAGGSVEQAVESGSLVAGTPDDLIEAIEKVRQRSGGVGGILALAHEWADTAATKRSFELVARYVMPRFQGQLDVLEDARDWFEDNARTIFAQSGAATVKAFSDAGKELPPEMKEMMERAAKARAEREAKAREAQEAGDGDGEPAAGVTGGGAAEARQAQPST